MQKIFLHGLLAGLVSAIVCLFYSEVYSTSLQVDFSDVINIFSVMGTCLFGSLIASAGYYFLSTKLSDGDVTDVLFNITFLTLTFLSCIYPFSVQLPLELDSPELFPGLVIPMHFFPVLFWIAFNPIFKHGRT
ncbi:MAG: hypothetical protein QNK63_02730 [Flavobacteriales bacterium]|jgi:hypothetical protein|tara:strand:- start:2877 stop:3275 length:399 start_codon:yes stop_codon:yes gene_type:complete